MMASANPLSLCIPLVREKDRQPTRGDAFWYRYMMSQRVGLEWTVPDVWFWVEAGK
uniref:NADH dehydrogenase [ubiquinone] 1 beta subcomplex subunit 2, mitochondrial n=1 Tax=Mesocestoides corti TaxID=53468 RepID=A0A5K3FZD7_MESCO